jgi:hypothetical protein
MSPRTSWERIARGPDNDHLKAACELTLIFHGNVWDDDTRREWAENLTTIYAPEPVPSMEATTKVLCDAHRHALRGS